LDSRFRGNDKEFRGNDKEGRGNDKEFRGNDKEGRGNDKGEVGIKMRFLRCKISTFGMTTPLSSPGLTGGLCVYAEEMDSR